METKEFYQLSEEPKIVQELEDDIPKHLTDTHDYIPETVIGIIVSHEKKTKKFLQALFNTGCSASLICHEMIPADMQKSLETDPNEQTTWHTKGGTFSTDNLCKVSYQLPEFTPN